MNSFRVSAADAGDLANGKLAWDVLNQTGCHTHSIPDAVDLSDCVMLKPYALACLAALAAKSKQRGTPIRLTLPRDARCTAHCLRLKLHEWFEAEMVVLPAARETNVAIDQIERPPDETFSNAIMNLLIDQASLPVGILPNLENHLDEVVSNAVTHAESEIGCIVVGQGFPRKRVVEVAIVDLGMGILKHLSRNPMHSQLRSDEDAILHAVQEGVTGTVGLNRWGANNSGIGLHELVRYSQQGHAETAIISGSSICVFSKESPIKHLIKVPFRGCLVNIRFFL